MKNIQIDRRDFLRQLGAVTATFSGTPLICSEAKEGAPRKKINLLFICTDQQHPRVSGYRGNPVVKTPHMDALAADGMHFTRAYVACPVCGPSRAAYMYGKHIHQIRNWYNGTSWPKDETSWAKMMTDDGYQTAHFGKMDSPGKYHDSDFTEEWHSKKRSPSKRKENAPDTRFLPHGQRNAKGHLTVKTFDIHEYKTKSEKSNAYGQYSMDRPATDRALKFLEARKNDKKPWMLHLGLLMPHWPLTLPKKYYDMYADVNIPMPHDAKFPNKDIHPALQHFQKWDGLDKPADDFQERMVKGLKAYYGMVTCLDAMVGEVVNSLKKDGMYKNTYIIFTSDHGDNLGEHGLIGNKHTPMEGSVSVPLIIAGPGIAHGSKTDLPVSLVDLYPTIMQMANIKHNDPDMPGQSLLPFLKGDLALANRTIFSEWHGTGFRGAWYMLADRKYKYIYYERDRASLFDLQKDPQEINDLALDPSYAEMLKDYEKKLTAILDPIKVARMARKDQGLITADGKDLMFEDSN